MSLFQTILSDLEDKFNKKNNQNEKIALLVSTILHTHINADQITVRDMTLQIKASPTIKMAINLNKDKILIGLKEAGFTEISAIQ